MSEYKYKTVAARGEAEQVIEKSRFIAYAAPVSTREEADAFIASVRAAHRDATHNVPAMVIGDKFQIQWGSDDGEPQGTSGAPIVQMLVKEGITNVAIVVTRYFGGIKLGTGGLVRAYTSSAKLGIQSAGLCGVKDMAVLTARVDYTYLSRLQNMAQKGEGGFSLRNITYEDKLTMELVCEPENLGNLRALLSDITGGKAEILTENIENAKIILDTGKGL